MGYIQETDVDEYKHTNFTKAMSIDVIGNGYFPMLVVNGRGALEFVEYAKRTGYKNHVDASDTSTMQALQTKLDFFELNEARGYGTHFNNHMGGYRQGRLPWMYPKFFPVQGRLISGADASPESPFLVDVGGSVGHDIAQFQSLHPSHPGKLILQDMPAVIGQIETLDPNIERMGHDFFTEQPIKGARAYNMHSILHDWPDDKCNLILSRLTAAMKTGYSSILINENVMPNTNAWWESMALDMVMMSLFSSEERTYEDWKTLLGNDGLKIVRVWSGGRGGESLIECELT
ncbi:Demethylsterigmatocystin 6-O-methyltransferase [Cytospora mali]|uniref:Demethylsterigmatocystin 6-O-methyltransferase n=1 Tax=Cytospora mali TaxID=578113 RepID=A0A194UY21_CYTMA|nr:Demethylsterigmatocystin 6-O-methyltransferase [Valsa mali var. pyri (nom. inval.)]